jgi:hypothetical protein
MITDAQTLVTAFADLRLIGAGPLLSVMSAIKATTDAGATVLVFDDATAHPVELDLRGSLANAKARLTPAPAKGPGRPKLGVTAREVTLLPRHWEWLAAQPGGASVALRKLVEAARRGDGKAEVRAAQTTVNRFMSAMAGDLPGFEEAGRALFAGDKIGFERETNAWPEDIRHYARRLAEPAFGVS